MKHCLLCKNQGKHCICEHCEDFESFQISDEGQLLLKQYSVDLQNKIEQQRAEIEHLKEFEKASLDVLNLFQENTRLKSEVERLTERENELVEDKAHWINMWKEQVGCTEELQKQVDELKGGKGLFISQGQIDWVCSLGVMVHIDEDSPVVLLNRHKYENTCADIDRRQFHFDEEIHQTVKDTSKEILQEAENLLHECAIEYANAGHKDYFGVCEVISHKVIRKIAKDKGVEME